MRFLVTGINGQLGYDVVKELKSRGYTDIVECDRNLMDITNQKRVYNVITDSNPDVIFHCAAYTAVDKAEDDKKKCFQVNVEGTYNILDAAKDIGAKVVYVSTDYVFDGTKEINSVYNVNDETNPLNVYGKTKEEGERLVRLYDKHFIVRTSWVFGINGNNFVKTMLKLSENRDEISVVSDQIGCPTYTPDLAKTLVDMSLTDKYGTYHVNNSGCTSWYNFAKYIFESNNIDMKVNPILTKDYGAKAPRPLNSNLSQVNLKENGFDYLPDWKDAVNRYNIELKNENKLILKK